MDSFKILGISKTQDVKEIRRAYSKLLTKYSPEKDPEGFQMLRAAYEEAISGAKNSVEESQRKLSPIDEFMEEFQSNYKCFEKRIEIETWKALLEKDICYNIDSSKEISHRILSFMMDNYNFTSKAWELFNNYFSWTSKREILCDEFPANFINFIIYKINNKSSFDYEFLKTCKENEQDLFIAEYRKLDDAIYASDLYAASVSIDAARKLCGDHPNLIILIARYLVINGQVKEAEELFTHFINNHEDAINGYFYRADLYAQIGKLQESYEDYKMVLSINKDYYGALYGLAKDCICLKKYEEAIEYSEKLSQVSAYRQDIRIISKSAYNFYIDSVLENNTLDSMDNNLRLKLAKAYFETSRLDESLNILNELMQREDECTSDMYELYCIILLKQNNTELVYSTVCKALDIFEDSLKLNFLKADILDELGRFEESIKQYDKVISINKDNSTAYNNKSYVLNKLKRYNESLESSNKAIELDPESAHSYKNKAVSLLRLELYGDCLEACEQAINKYQYLTEVYIIKMEAFISMNHLEEALTVFNKTSEFGLKDSKLYHQKARALMYLGKYEDSIIYCDRALELDENNVDFYYVKGLCFYYKEEYDKAISLFDIAIKQDSLYGGAYFYKIRCLLFCSKDKEASEVIDQAIFLNMEYIDKFYNFKGSILSNEKKYEDAILEFKKAIEIEPSIGEYYYSVGRAYSEMKKYTESVEYYDKSIDLDPDTIEAYVNVSHCYYCMQKYKECIEYCIRAININDDYIISHQNKGWAHYRLGDIINAEKELNIALKLDGNNEDVLLLKLRISTDKKQYQEALLVCERMLELNNRNEDAIKAKKELLIEVKKQKKGFVRSLFGNV